MNSNNMERSKGSVLYMWGYLPGASPEKSPLLSPAAVTLPDSGDSWKDVCGGGCGFALATSELGKLLTWGSTEDQGQSFVTSGKHGEIPAPFPLQIEDPIVKAAAGWAHCASLTEAGEVYTWGWKECVPLVKFFGEVVRGDGKEIAKDQNSSIASEEVDEDEGSMASEDIKSIDSKNSSEETVKRRKMLPPKHEIDSAPSVDEALWAPPCRVPLGQGVKIWAVAAGGRHTLALSDMGQVWGWGYGGEGQLGLGTRVKMVSSPHVIPCIESSSCSKDKTSVAHQGSLKTKRQHVEVPGSYVKRIACGGRHSAVITDSGALITFGWGLYGQCGQGSTSDLLRPTCVSSLVGIRMEQIAAGLWHTICISVEGHVYTFGGNQFGQLGTGIDNSETLPKLLEVPSLENKNAKIVSCGARHSAIITDDHQLFCWGWNKYGQLGLGDSIDRKIPAQVVIENKQPINVACGWWHTLLMANPVS